MKIRIVVKFHQDNLYIDEEFLLLSFLYYYIENCGGTGLGFCRDEHEEEEKNACPTPPRPLSNAPKCTGTPEGRKRCKLSKVAYRGSRPLFYVLLFVKTARRTCYNQTMIGLPLNQSRSNFTVNIR